MNKFKQFFRDNFHSLMLTIIFLSLAGSLTMLGFQSVQQTRQIEATRYLAEQIREDSQKQHNAQDDRNECLLRLFVSFINNRTEVTSASIDECKVSVNGVPVSQTEPEPQPVAQTPPKNSPQAAPKAPQAPSTQQPVTSTPRTSPTPTAPPTPQQPTLKVPLPIELRIN